MQFETPITTGVASGGFVACEETCMFTHPSPCAEFIGASQKLSEGHPPKRRRVDATDTDQLSEQIEAIVRQWFAEDMTRVVAPDVKARLQSVLAEALAWTSDWKRDDPTLRQLVEVVIDRIHTEMARQYSVSVAGTSSVAASSRGDSEINSAAKQQQPAKQQPTPRRSARGDQKKQSDVASQHSLYEYLQPSTVSAFAAPGIRPWPRGPSRPPVRVEVVVFDDPRLPPLDGSVRVTTTNGKAMPLQPLANGSTVIEFGMGGGKTVRVIAFLAALGLPILFVTPRKNLACKLDKDLRAAGVDCHMYKAAPDNVSVTSWCQHSVTVISTEQVDKCRAWKHLYTGGAIIFDEFTTATASFGGETVRDPMTTAGALNELALVCKYAIFMDADVSYLPPRTRAFIRMIAPMRDVLHLRANTAALRRTVFVAYGGLKWQAKAWADRMELDIFRSREARAAGEPNRTFYGGCLPKQVQRVSELGRDLGAACNAEGYHGKMVETKRQLHLADPDVHMESHDLTATSTVMAIGTDLGLKYSHAFFETHVGSALHGAPSNSQEGQIMGRPGRRDGSDLDPLTVGDTTYPGAMFLKIAGKPPTIKDLDQVTPEALARKFQEERELKRAAVDALNAQDEACYAAYNGQQGGTAELALGFTPPPKISECLEEILAWNDLQSRLQYQNHAADLLAILRLPTRDFDLQPMSELSEAEVAELAAFREQMRLHPPPTPQLTADEQLGAKPDAQTAFHGVLDHIAAQDDRQWAVAQFFENAFGYCQKQRLATPDTNLAAKLQEVWGTLKRVRTLPPTTTNPETGERYSKIYADLHADGKRDNIYNRALMLHVPTEALTEAYVDRHTQTNMVHSLSMASLPAAVKMPLLETFAAAVGLTLRDLLTPRVFSEADAWVRAHNRFVRREATPDDESMAARARTAAEKLGIKGLNTRGSRPDSLKMLMGHVMTQSCAMRERKSTDDHRNPVERGTHRGKGKTLVSWAFEELAPDWAEQMWVWHKGAHTYVKAMDYRSTPARAEGV